VDGGGELSVRPNESTITKGKTMRIQGNASGRRSVIAGGTVAAALAMTLTACSGTSSTLPPATSTPQTAATPVASVAATTSAPASASAPASSSPPVAASGLSGTWSGQYSGASQGNFTLNWTQSGSALSGTIELEADGTSMPIHGTIVGDSIQFGTVGSTGITYKGTVSGNSMSGTYQLASNGTTFSGPWTAAKSS
jgi:hypothetical protein